MIRTSDGYLVSAESWSDESGDKTQDARGYGDFWVIRFDQALNEVWQRTIGGALFDDRPFLIELGDSEDFLLCGSSTSPESGDKTAPNQGNYDFWVIRMNTEGNEIWQQTYGGESRDFLSSVITLPDGSILLGGQSYSDVSGDRTAPKKGVCDYWLVCIDKNGTKLWDRSYGGAKEDRLTDMAVTNSGNVALVGTSDSPASIDKSEDRFVDQDLLWDGWVLVLDDTWSVAWDRTIGGEGHESGGNIINMGDRLLVGMSSSSDSSGTKSENARGSQDYWVTFLYSNGTIAWDRTIGGDGSDGLNGMLTITENLALLLGGSDSDSSFDKDHDSKGSFDYWPFIIDSSSLPVWQATLGADSIDVLIDAVEVAPWHFMFLGFSSSGSSGDKSEPLRGVSDLWLLETMSSVGVSEEAPLELSMQPNPATEHLLVRWEQVSHACAGHLRVFATNGQMVQDELVVRSTTTVRIGHLPQGLYSVRLTDCSGQTVVERFVKLNR